MSELIPLLFGSLRDHPAAAPFAREVVRVHKRYATEVVYGHRLCPFLRDVNKDFGRFCIAMPERPDLDEARAAFIQAESALYDVGAETIELRVSPVTMKDDTGATLQGKRALYDLKSGSARLVGAAQ